MANRKKEVTGDTLVCVNDVKGTKTCSARRGGFHEYRHRECQSHSDGCNNEGTILAPMIGWICDDCYIRFGNCKDSGSRDFRSQVLEGPAARGVPMPEGDKQ
jgi:hypothetical protein